MTLTQPTEPAAVANPRKPEEALPELQASTIAPAADDSPEAEKDAKSELAGRVRAWLENADRSHVLGIELLKEIGCKNRSLISFLSAREQDHQKAKLYRELHTWYESAEPEENTTRIEEVIHPLLHGAQDSTPATEPAAVESALQPTPDPQNAKTRPELEPVAKDEVEKLVARAVQIKGEMAKLSNSLRKFAEEDVEGRKAVVDQQDELFKEKKGIEKKISDLKSGRRAAAAESAPEDKPNPEQEAKLAKLKQDKRVLQSYIARVKDGLILKKKTQTERDNAVAQKELELTEVTNQIRLLEAE